MKSHRETYPEQYAHPIVGKRVRIKQIAKSALPPIEGVVERVMATSWGPLVDLGTTSEDGNPVAYRLADADVIE